MQSKIRSVMKSLETRKGDIGDMERERQAFYVDVAELLSEISREKTTVFLIDNFQWADRSSIALLTYLVSNPFNGRIMIVSAYTPELEGDDFISGVITGLTLEGKAQVMILDRMDETNTTVLLERLLGTRLPSKFAHRIYKETEGHPLFTTSLVKSLVEDGIINPKDKNWTDTLEEIELKLPKNVKDIVLRRLKLLDAEVLSVLKAASVLGPQFRFDILAGMMKVDAESLHGFLSRLTEAKLVFQLLESKVETYRFAHVNIRETVYQNLGGKEKKTLHKSAGQTYALLFGDKPEFAYLMAHHFSLCGSHDKAFGYAKWAGEIALQRNATDEAALYFKNSLKSLRKIKGKDKVKFKQEILIKLGDVEFITGNWKKANKHYTESLKLGVESEDMRLTSVSNRKLGELFRFQGEYSKARNRFEKALEVSEKIRDSRGIADSYKGLGYLFWRKGDYPKAIEYYDRCIRTAMELDDHELLGVAILEKGNVFNTMGDLTKAMEMYKTCVVHLEKVNNLSQIARAYNNMGDVSLQRESWEQAMDYFERSKSAAEKVGGRYMVAWSLFNEAEALSRLNRPDEAIDKCRSSYEILNSLGDKMGLLAVHKNLAIAYGLKKDWKSAQENFKKSLAMAKELKIPDVKAEIYLHKAQMFKGMGEIEKARSDLSTALKIAKSVNAKRWVDRIEREVKAIG
jgi:predicted ATPase